MTGFSLERLADTLYPKESPKDTHAYGTVESVNLDGSYQVKLNASATTTRCAKLCDAEVGDRVMVVIQGNGHCAAIGRVGGAKKYAVLYDSTPAATVTLSQSAADFDYMRIYFKKNGDSNACGSVDVFEPNGKNVSLFVVNAYGPSGTQFAGRTVSISGTSIASVNKEEFSNSGGGGGALASSPSVYIYRVEAW